MNENYEAAWEEYRRKRMLYWIVWAAFIPVILFANSFPAMPLPKSIDARLVFFVLWGIVWIIAGNNIRLWRCPRCHNHFHRIWLGLGGTVLTQRCVHCGLRKFATTDDEEEL